MFSLLYVSSAVKPFTRQQLLQLLEHSRANNAQLNVTGMLLYKNGNFMQALEGEEAAVRSVHKKIGADTRHRGMLVLLQRHQHARDFSGWSMGFRDLNSEQARPTGGYNEFTSLDLMDEPFFSDPSNAQKLLLSFRKATA